MNQFYNYLNLLQQPNRLFENISTQLYVCCGGVAIKLNYEID